MIKTIIVVSLTALKKHNLLYKSSTQSASSFKTNPFFIFNLKTLRLSKSRIFGPRKDSN